MRVEKRGSFVSAATLEFFLLLASEFALILQRSILYSFKCHKRGPRIAGKGHTDMYLGKLSNKSPRSVFDEIIIYIPFTFEVKNKARQPHIISHNKQKQIFKLTKTVILTD